MQSWQTSFLFGLASVLWHAGHYRLLCRGGVGFAEAALAREVVRNGVDASVMGERTVCVSVGW